MTKVSNVNLCKKEFEADLFASFFIISDDEIKEINDISIISNNYNLDYRICEKRIKEFFK